MASSGPSGLPNVVRWGVFAYRMADSMPDGYAFENIAASERDGNVVRSRFRIFKDGANALSGGEALSLARSGLLEFIRDVRCLEATDRIGRYGYAGCTEDRATQDVTHLP